MAPSKTPMTKKQILSLVKNLSLRLVVVSISILLLSFI